MQSLRQPSLEKQLQDVAAEFAKGGPRMVDKETRLDEVVAGPGLMLSYRYTAMAVSSANMPSAATFREFSSATTHKVCASDMKQLLEKKVALKYLYRDRRSANSSSCAPTVDRSRGKGGAVRDSTG
jgi:hypothetical protein